MQIRFASLLLLFPLIATAQTTRPSLLPIDKMEHVLGSTGIPNPTGRIVKFSFPRPELRADAKLPIPTPTSHVGFQVGHRKPSILVAELVLRPQEVNAAVSAALDNDLSVTALACRTLDGPRIEYLNLDAEGDPVLLSIAMRKVFDAIQHATPSATAATVPGVIDPKPLDAIFATTAKNSDGFYQVDFPHKVELPCGCNVGPDMGIKSSATFTGPNDRAFVQGQIACIAGQLQQVLKILRRANIDITAIQNHMELEAPRTLYVHFQAKGRADVLAKAIKSAVDSQRPPSNE